MPIGLGLNAPSIPLPSIFTDRNIVFRAKNLMDEIKGRYENEAYNYAFSYDLVGVYNGEVDAFRHAYSAAKGAIAFDPAVT